MAAGLRNARAGDVRRRVGHGQREPVADRRTATSKTGEVDARIELTEGVLGAGRARRSGSTCGACRTCPDVCAMPVVDAGLRGPYRRSRRPRRRPGAHPTGGGSDVRRPAPDRAATSSTSSTQQGGPRTPSSPARVGMVVEDRAIGFCGDIVKITAEAVTLRDRHGDHATSAQAGRLPARRAGR